MRRSPVVAHPTRGSDALHPTVRSRPAQVPARVARRFGLPAVHVSATLPPAATG